MNKRTEAILQRSPHPLKWGIAMLMLLGISAIWHSVLVGILAGIVIGLYFGNYRGRFTIMKAWRLQMEADYRESVNELDSVRNLMATRST